MSSYLTTGFDFVKNTAHIAASTAWEAASNLSPSILLTTTGVSASAYAAGQFCKGKFESATAYLCAGILNINVASISSGFSERETHQLYKGAVIGAGAGTVASGVRELLTSSPQAEEPDQAPPKGDAPGYLSRLVQSSGFKIIAGLGTIWGALKISPRLNYIAVNTLALAGLSSLMIKSGIRDYQNQGGLRGTLNCAAKVLTGVGVIAGTAYATMLELQQEPQKLDYLEFRDPSSFFPDEEEGQCPDKRITLATIYDNGGNRDRDEISEMTTANHREYAKRWGCGHDVIKTSIVRKHCFNPIAKRNEDCSPYWNKMQYFNQVCQLPSKGQGTQEYYIFGDDDGVYTNMGIDPRDAIARLRGGRNCSFIIATEGPGSRHNSGATNTGFMILQKDERGCAFVRKIWESRNFLRDPNSQNPTHGMSLTQAPVDNILFRDHPTLVVRDVCKILPRDETHPIRGGIAINTLYRGGCHSVYKNGRLSKPWDIDKGDVRSNMHGIARPGDLFVQTGGYPVYGQDLTKQAVCKENPDVPVEPIRIKKIRELIEWADRSVWRDPRPPEHPLEPWDEVPNDRVISLGDFTPRPVRGFKARRITIGAVYYNSDPKRDKISDIANANHARYARKWGLEHRVVSERLVGDACTDTSTGLSTRCVDYWNKIKELLDWSKQPATPGIEDWRFYLDDDMLVMNQRINPYEAIDRLRRGMDTSVIVAQDLIDWQRWHFAHPVKGLSVNTGMLIVRRDNVTSTFLEAVWEGRNLPPSTVVDGCETMGTCIQQEVTMQEQEVMTMVLRQYPELVGTAVSAPQIREIPGIAMNSYHRVGCFTKGDSTRIHSFEQLDGAEYPEGQYQRGDWTTQVAGVPVSGRRWKIDPDVGCKFDASVPITEPRYEMMRELAEEEESFEDQDPVKQNNN